MTVKPPSSLQTPMHFASGKHVDNFYHHYSPFICGTINPPWLLDGVPDELGSIDIDVLLRRLLFVAGVDVSKLSTSPPPPPPPPLKMFANSAAASLSSFDASGRWVCNSSNRRSSASSVFLFLSFFFFFFLFFPVSVLFLGSALRPCPCPSLCISWSCCGLDCWPRLLAQASGCWFG